MFCFDEIHSSNFIWSNDDVLLYISPYITHIRFSLNMVFTTFIFFELLLLFTLIIIFILYKKSSKECFSGLYLWTGELAPTSHRGFVFSACSLSARIGSFIGPYIFNNLAPVTPKAVPLGGLAFLSALCAVGAFLLVETGDKKICVSAEDVEGRRKKYFKYQI